MRTFRFFKFALTLVIIALGFASCGKDNEPSDEPGFEEPTNINYISGNEGDSRLERLATPVGRYIEPNGLLCREVYTHRIADQYVIWPTTEARKTALDALSQTNPERVIEIEGSRGGYMVCGDRSLIDKTDYVSDVYFIGYYNGNPDVMIVGPQIVIKAATADALEKINNKFGNAIKSVTDKGSSAYRIDCKATTSQQVMELADAIYRLPSIEWATANTLVTIHKDV